MSEGFTDRAKNLFKRLTGTSNDAEAPWLDGADFDPDQSTNFYTTDKEAMKPISKPEQKPQIKPETPMSRSRPQEEVDAQDALRLRALEARLADQAKVRPTSNEGTGKVQQPPNSAGRRRF